LEFRIHFSATPVTLYSFSGSGTSPEGIIIDSAGNLYGTNDGGSGGNVSIWELAKGSATVTTLCSLPNTGNGISASSITIDNGGNLYGTTEYGGTNGDGIIWELLKGSSTATVLYSFTDAADGKNPNGITIDAAGNLYGTNYGGGVGTGGTLWELANNGGAYSSAVVTLYAFNSLYSNLIVDYGENPDGIAVDGNGNLYYTSLFGGTGFGGGLWELGKRNSSPTMLYSFTGGTTGSSAPGDPQGITIDSSGNIYGTTQFGTTQVSGTGPLDGYGTVWELAKGSGTLTILYSFTDGADGGITRAEAFVGITIDSSGNLYGTAAGGSANVYDGTLWELASGSSTLATLYSSSTGAGPLGIAVDGSGNYFGTTEFGGAHDDGTVWELGNGSNALTTLYSFTNIGDGATPSGIALDGNGNVFGVASTGGAHGDGTIWELAKGSGALTTLYSFTNGADGEAPTWITIDGGGNLYGVASGGIHGRGTIWELPKGSSGVTTLYSFTGGADGGGPNGITIDSAGNLYGTNLGGNFISGGFNVYTVGAVWELPKNSNMVATLTSWPSTDTPDEMVPEGITIDVAGNLYGEVYNAASLHSYGLSVWELAKGSSYVNTLYSFVSLGIPVFLGGGLSLDSGGNLYATNMGGYPGLSVGVGTFFELAGEATPALAAPSGVAASQATFPHHVQLTWNSVGGAASYQVFRSTTNDVNTATKIGAGITATVFNDNGTTPGTLYYYWVRARNPSTIGSFSVSVSGYIPLTAPTGVAATMTLPHHVAITWNPVAGAAGYQIFRSASNDFNSAIKIASGITTTFFDDTSVVHGQNYFYWVRARNPVGAGTLSISVMGSLG
jgi:uncharacterized repeat protein (TIGR03803 family)